MSIYCLCYYHKPLGKKRFINKIFFKPTTKNAVFKIICLPLQNWIFFHGEVVEYLIKITKLYAGRKKEDISLTLINLRCVFFLGILMQSGNNVLPRGKMYWENSTNVKNESISNAMSQNRFEEIMTMLLCCDNNNFTQTS